MPFWKRMGRWKTVRGRILSLWGATLLVLLVVNLAGVRFFIDHTESRTWMALSLFVLVGFICFAYVALRITAWWLDRLLISHLRKLVEGARRLGAGELTYRVGITEECEVGALAVAFDEMAQRLFDQNHALEQQARETTRLFNQSQAELADRTRAEQALQTSEERLKTILNALQTGILVVDAETHRILDANPAALRMVEAESREALVGQVCHSRLCPAAQGKCPITDLHQEVDNSERSLICADGSRKPILKTVIRVQLDGRPALLESFVDISRQKKAETALLQARAELETRVEERTQALQQANAGLERRVQVDQLVATISSRFFNAGTAGLEDNVQQALGEITRLAGADRGFVFFLTDEGQFLNNAYEWFRPGIPPLKQDLQHIPVQSIPWGASILADQGALIVSAESDLPAGALAERRLWDTYGIRSALIVPLSDNGRPVGCIGFSTIAWGHAWPAETTLLLKVVGEMIINALLRKGAGERSQHWTTSLEMMREIGLSLSAELDLTHLLERIAQSAAALVDSDVACFYIYESATDDLVCCASVGDQPLPVGAHVPRGEGLSGKVLESGVEQVINQYSTWPGRMPAYEGYAVRAVAANPVAWGKEILGVLTVANYREDPFAPADLQLLGLLANQAAVAIRNARILAEQNTRRKQAEALLHANAVLTSTLDLDKLLHNLVAAALNAIPGASQGRILLVNRAAQTLVTRAAVGFSESRLRRRGIPLKEAWVRQALSSGQPKQIPIVNPDTGNLGIYDPSIRSIIAAPLQYHDQIIGLLTVDCYDGDTLEPDALDILEAFANQAAAAIENASLFEKVKSMAVTDSLTGLANRGSILEIAAREVEMAQQAHRPCSLVLWDIDHFKVVNDTYGHPVGDRVLQIMAERSRKSIREMDFIGRYGGEEFLAILPGTSLKESAFVAERLRNAIGSAPVCVDGHEIGLTISVGVCALNGAHQELRSLLEQVDRALYRAKQNGRNRVEFWGIATGEKP